MELDLIESQLADLNAFPKELWDEFVKMFDDGAGCFPNEQSLPAKFQVFSKKLKVNLAVNYYRCGHIDVVEICFPEEKYSWVNSSNRIFIEKTYRWTKGFTLDGSERIFKAFDRDPVAYTTGRKVVPILELLGVSPFQNWDIPKKS